MIDSNVITLSNKYATYCTRALLLEPYVWPRFGLVGPLDEGSHQDMNYKLLSNSALSLKDFFKNCFIIGNHYSLEFLSSKARFMSSVNKDDIRVKSYTLEMSRYFLIWYDMYSIAIKQMFIHTKGVNTYKGIAYILGLFVFIQGLCKTNTIFEILNSTYRLSISCILDAFKNSHNLNVETYGIWAYNKYKVLGIREHFINNFIYIRKAWQWFNLSKLPDHIKYGILRVFFLSVSQDTNIIKRSNYDTLVNLQKTAFMILRTQNWNSFFENTIKLENIFIKNKLSAAASGDLIVIILYFSLLSHDNAHST